MNSYNTSAEYWNKVYRTLVSNDKNKLDEICTMFRKIGAENDMSRNEFADMVVAAIQNIPYVLVHDMTCKEAVALGGFMTQWHRQGNACLPNIAFGIQSPVEFMSNFQGDCDTRSVLCYYVLSRFKYDAAVLISDNYGHSILGINLNVGGGDYVKYRGKRYYAWETTATGYGAGQVPGECSNMRYWEVALVNK